MLRLWDARAGSYAVLASSSVPLRVCVHGPTGRAWSGLDELRVLLVADALTRQLGLLPPRSRRLRQAGECQAR